MPKYVQTMLDLRPAFSLGRYWGGGRRGGGTPTACVCGRYVNMCVCGRHGLHSYHFTSSLGDFEPSVNINYWHVKSAGSCACLYLAAQFEQTRFVHLCLRAYVCVL